MAEKTKTATATPKPRKAPAKKKAALSNVTEITVGREEMTIARDIPREEIAKLAHQFWNERGRQHGHDAEDWLRAELLLRGKAS